MADELNERQEALIEAVRSGAGMEDAPDTEDQLLTLARRGYLTAVNDEDGWHFSAPGTSGPTETEPEEDKPKPKRTRKG